MPFGFPSEQAFSFTGIPTDDDDSEESLSSDAEVQLDYSGRNNASATLSYCVGVAVGRWDVRIALDMALAPSLGTAFSPLPAYPPGLLLSPDGRPARPGKIASNQWLVARRTVLGVPSPEVPHSLVADVDYPIRISWDGILVDDPEHIDDVCRRVREAYEVLWNKEAETVEKAACEAIGVKELRDYFRKPGKGGFWEEHISRYTKSRRKAPIYWLLQSSKKNYSLWLYYHRLDKDLFFKAKVKYVEPKIRLEVSRLETLRNQRATAGESGKDAKRLAKIIEQQEDFISELRDFEDKLRRAASLNLEPDLNDGVGLNIAPLHELVPWKEARSYWNELLEGKYEWSSIGKQLRQKGLVK